MLNVKYAGFGGYMEVPCYEDEKGKLYFDENNGVGGLNLYTGAYKNEDGEILGEPDTKVTESVECAEPFVRHPRERDYRMLARTDNTVKNVTDSVTFDEEEQKEILPR